MLLLGLRGALPFPDKVCPLVKKESVEVGLGLLMTPPSMDAICRGTGDGGGSEEETVRENFLLNAFICLPPLLFEAIGGLFAIFSSSESFDSAELDAATVSDVFVELLLEYKLLPSGFELFTISLYLIETKLAVVPML
jgi:hypothetical protein